jgi:hypothetical protein
MQEKILSFLHMTSGQLCLVKFKLQKFVVTTARIKNWREHHKGNKETKFESSTCCLEQNIRTPRMVIQILGHIINLQRINHQTLIFLAVRSVEHMSKQHIDP